jgi:hypothetical protein
MFVTARFGLKAAALLAVFYVPLVQGDTLTKPPTYGEESTEPSLPQGYIIEYDVR